MQVFVLAGIALFLMAFLVVPLLRVIVIAFTGPDGLTLVHFGDFFATGLLRESFWNSIYVGVMTVVVASLIAVPLATILARFRFRGAAVIQTLGVVPLVMPPFVGAVAMQLIFGRNGTINLLLNDWFGFTHPVHGGLNGVIFVEALHYFPFILLNLSAALANIDSGDGGIGAEPRRARLHAVPRASSSRWRCRAMWRAPRWCSSKCSTISARRFCSTSPTCWRRRPI